MKTNKKRITRRQAELVLYSLILALLLVSVHNFKLLRKETSAVSKELDQMLEDIQSMRRTNAEILSEFGYTPENP